MSAPKNTFKQALKNREPQIGLWLGLANNYTAELIASAGFDWLLLDGEHAPNTLPTFVGQLQAIAPFKSHPIIRPAWADHIALKQILDLGVQTILAPMVDDAEQAAAIVKATRYPPLGMRGVGSALARASQFNRTPNYLTTANDEICVLVQIESVKAVQALEAILAVEGVDGVFIGPADLSASLGYIGQPNHPDVVAVIENAIAKIIAVGKAPGILMADVQQAKHYLALGALFVAVGSDTGLLMNSTRALVNTFKPEQAKTENSTTSVY
ncbi:4-hydroxy-2-oxoheptanedioate aldolase [Marinomonas sp. IMCC 4694]|uniref:4-hydroxy-2-oxoheptanedioate aldolase n=1 Tax=Marinomonas sp. IMCC 4694 TaxID=2605432 RepID=UPI0011E79B83|nr:4-hydroxy-2-oxoheptanedioate aldolase [Marinomonas sp. IMCC 4694]TYL47685.1 4-hydroxy-2-oxoheptanedioate aldolase [Marinomonas sp. IMCC 4694]